MRGTFALAKTLELGPEASNVTFRGPAVISGAWRLDKWTRGSLAGHETWVASVPPGVRFRAAWEGERRLLRPTLPAGDGFFHFADYPAQAQKDAQWNVGCDSMIAAKGDLHASWHNLQDVEIVAHHLWVTSRLPIQSVNEDTGLVKFDRPSVFKLSDDSTGGPAAYRVENVAEALGPGEFYLDRQTGLVHVSGKRPSPVWAPHLATLVKVSGAKGVRFEGLTLAYTDWDLPAGYSGDGQASISVPGALILDGTSGSSVEHCRFAHLGGWALELAGSANGNLVERCRMEDFGGGGVKIGHGTRSTTLEDSTIEGGGRTFASAEGVWIGNSGHNVIAFNRIRDFYYTAVSVGWTWGYGASDAVENRIEGNDISEIGQGELSDLGGIYTLGVSPGTVLKGNRITDVRSRSYGGWGIYLDEGSSGIVVEDNLVMNTATGGFHQHYGKDNIVRNNLFAFAQRAGQVIRTRVENHRSFSFEGNVVVWKGTPLFGGDWSTANVDFNRNLFWRTDGAVTLPPFVGPTNVVANPHLGPRGEFGPEVHQIGFQPLPTEFGPRKRKDEG